jgi:spore germination protein YaaH
MKVRKIHLPAAALILLVACSPKVAPPGTGTSPAVSNLTNNPSTQTYTAQQTQTSTSVTTQMTLVLSTQTFVTQGTVTSYVVSTQTVTSISTHTYTTIVTPPPSTSTATATSIPITMATVPTAVGSRNFEQMNKTMSVLTGIDGNSAVINRYNAIKSQLPGTNDIKSFSFSGQIATTVLAAEYCNTLITSATYAAQRMAAVGTVNITLPPSQALTTAVKMDVAQKLITKFWAVGTATIPDPATAQSDIVNLITTLVTGETDSAATTKKALVGACTSVLASSPVMIF